MPYYLLIDLFIYVFILYFFVVNKPQQIGHFPIEALGQETH